MAVKIDGGGGVGPVQQPKAEPVRPVPVEKPTPQSVVDGFVHGVGDFAKGVLGGAGKLGEAVAKLASRDVPGFAKAAGEIFKQLAYAGSGFEMMKGLLELSALRQAVGVDKPGRKLTDDEKTALKAVYGDTIDYDKMVVHVIPNGLLGSDRAMSVGNDIFMPEGMSKASFTSTLIHEAAHTWQFQNGGPAYIAKALQAQLMGDGEGYLRGYDFAAGAAKGKGFSEMSPEQQAYLVQMMSDAGYDFASPGGKFEYDGKDYTVLARQAAEAIKARNTKSDV